MDKNKKENLSGAFWIVLISVCILLILLIGIGFVIFSHREKEVTEKAIGGSVVLNYSSNINGLKIIDSVPTSDIVGRANILEGTYFDFSVDTEIDEANYVEYEVSIIKDSSASTISDNDIKIYLEKEEDGKYIPVFNPSRFKGITAKSELGSNKGSMILTKVKNTKTVTDKYRLRLWLADTSLITNGSYAVEVDINGKAK